MYKKIFNHLIVFVFCVSVLTVMVVPVQAQGLAQTTEDIVTFNQLQVSEIRLDGPYDVAGILFGLPADWKLVAGAELDLQMSVSFNTDLASQFDYPVGISGGLLTIYLNNYLLGVLPLNDTGEVERKIVIPVDALKSTRPDGGMLLSFDLDSSDFCYFNEQFTMLIHPESYFSLPHEAKQPDTSLVNFPRPIYQNSFKEDTAVMVLPDQPTAGEMQAALTVAASLGNFTGNDLILDMTSVGKMTTEQAENNHLIFVGKPSSLSVLGELNLPQPVQDSEFQIAGGGVDDGVIQMVVSPWSNAHVAFVVSGNTDQGVIKAAQAISTGVLRPNRFPNLAIVQEVEPTPIQTSLSVDRPLSDLVVEDGRDFYNRGVNYSTNTFYIPPGMTVSPEATINLVVSHSVSMDFDQSSLTIELNGHPIGSALMDKETAGRSANTFKFEIPPSSVIPGNNQLDVIVSLEPIDDCTPPGTRGLWLRLWPESSLYLPLEETTVDSTLDADLATFPAPYIQNSTLGDTAFVLPSDDLESWRSATQLAAYLGFRANGPLTTLAAFFGNDFPEEERANYQLLVVGRPSTMSFFGELNESLPAPFADGSDIASEANLQVTYIIPSDSPLGYLEVIPSPWNANHIALGALGNTEQGVSWAVSSLTDPIASSQLAGNFAVVDDEQIITTDTRAVAVVNQPSDEGTPTPIVPPVNPKNQPKPKDTTAWVLPALIISVALIMLILVIVLLRRWVRNRRHMKNIEAQKEE